MTGADFSYQLVRVTCFGVVLTLMIAIECIAPRRRQLFGRARRWPANIAMVVIDTLTVRLIIPVAAVGIAALVDRQGWGLLHQTMLPESVRVVAAVVLLDLVIYAQHVGFHAVPLLWRIHRMHHSDPEIDVTTALRFHPAEIILSLLLKFAAIIMIGASPLAVLIFEIVLNATAMFNHSNIALPAWLDRSLRLVVVTPDMHRIHHSAIRRETDSNFGFNLPWWDRLFGTYRARPEHGQTDMVIGLADFRSAADQRIDQLLLQPFRQQAHEKG